MLPAIINPTYASSGFAVQVKAMPDIECYHQYLLATKLSPTIYTSRRQSRTKLPESQG
jgi:hypothetical protein